jgi:hypothetical protein
MPDTPRPFLAIACAAAAVYFFTDEPSEALAIECIIGVLVLCAVTKAVKWLR